MQPRKRRTDTAGKQKAPNSSKHGDIVKQSQKKDAKQKDASNAASSSLTVKDRAANLQTSLKRIFVEPQGVGSDGRCRRFAAPSVGT
jgi:hypothetical protein